MIVQQIEGNTLALGTTIDHAQQEIAFLRQ